MLLVAALLSQAALETQPARSMPVIDPRAGQPSSCPATSRYEASKRGKTPEAQKLNQLPNADVYRAVYRHIGECEVPIIVRYGVGR